MAARVNRGEIWLYEFKPPDKRRPVLILSRTDALRVLRTVLVAPITSQRRGSPAEVQLGIAEGLKTESAANLDHVQSVQRDRLRQFVGTVSSRKMAEVCQALAIATGCDVSIP